MLALLACTQLTTCDPPDRDFAPAIAAKNDRYTVAWVRPARKGGFFEVQQFDKRSLKPLAKPTTIARRDDLVMGAVELVPVEGGYLAIGRVEDPEKKPNWATHMFTVSLDENAQPFGKQHRFMFDRACAGAGVAGEYVLIAYKHIGRSHKYPGDDLGLLAVDHNGDYVGSRTVAGNPINCASAVRGRQMAIVWNRWRGSEPGKRTIGLYVSFEEAGRDGRNDTFVVPVGDVSGSPTRIAPLGDDWAILYADPDEHVHVAVIDSHGKLLRQHSLSAAIDIETVDLANNERGLFVSWIDGGRVRFVGIDGPLRTRKSAGGGASRTRALGADSQCVAAWTQHAKDARVAAFDNCP